MNFDLSTLAALATAAFAALMLVGFLSSAYRTAPRAV
jgi:hypothetical protein